MKKNESYDETVEISTNYLLFKQSIIAKSLGGLNIYCLSFTKKREVGAIPTIKKNCIYL